MSCPYSNSVWSVGLTTSTPLWPSSSAYWPVASCPLTSFNPTTAGMRSERAMIAVCDVLLPTSVANPSTFRLSSCAVLDGVKSWLMMMHGSLRVRRSASSSRPNRLFNTRVVTSRMSAARSRRYSSSMADSVAA